MKNFIYLLLLFSLSSFVRINNNDFIYRHNEKNKLSNIYIASEDNLVYDGISLKSNNHSTLLELVRRLAIEDNYHINHLFGQIFIILEDTFNKKKQLIHGLICWDPEKKELIACETFNNYPLANFVSRDKLYEPFIIDDCKCQNITADTCNNLKLSHSEHILINHFSEKIFYNYLEKNNLLKNWTIKTKGLLLYSSLDSCDACQNMLANLCSDFWVFFFSTNFCKQSSYLKNINNEQIYLQFDKRKNQFIRNDILFSTYDEKIDIVNSDPHHILFSHVNPLF